MEDFSIFKTLADYGLGAIFGGTLIYLGRRDHADALRRETQFSAALEVQIKNYMALQEKSIESTTKLERQMHELKNTLQRLVFELQRVFPASTGNFRSSGED